MNQRIYEIIKIFLYNKKKVKKENFIDVKNE